MERDNIFNLKRTLLQRLWLFWIFTAFIFFLPKAVIADTCSSYDYETATLHIPSVQIGDSFIWVDIKLIDSSKLLFRLTDYGEAEQKASQAVFNISTLKLDIPCVDMKLAITYQAEFTMLMEANNSSNNASGSSIDFVLNDIKENTTSSNTDIQRPEGWSEKTHDKSAEPDYSVVFEEGTVKRIDLVFTSEDWKAMLEDMTQLYGEFGTQESSGQPDNNLPPDNTGDNTRPTPPEGVIPPENIVKPDEAVVDNGQNNVNPGGNLSFAEENPVWKPCTIEFEGKKWYFAGVRFKGNSSLNSSWKSGIMKLPFRFDFDKFEDEHQEINNQRFYGFEQLSLASNYRDESLIREKIAADIFRDAGVPAPRTAFYRVYVDYGEGAKYFGLYTMVEIPSKPMIASQFSKTGGNLYKPEGDGASFATYDEESFDKETNEDEADFSDVKALYDALHADRQNAEEWRNGLEKVLDVDGFLRWLAVNTLIQNWDTYGKMAHNYYLYNDPGDNLIHWIPWDNNEALKDTGNSNTQVAGNAQNGAADFNGGGMGGGLSLALTSDEAGENWPLIRYLIDDPVYYTKYVNMVKESAQNVFYPDRMTPIYTQAHELIKPYVTGDYGEIEGYTFLSSADSFDTALDYLINHVQSRFDAAEEFVNLNQ